MTNLTEMKPKRNVRPHRKGQLTKSDWSRMEWCCKLLVLQRRRKCLSGTVFGVGSQSKLPQLTFKEPQQRCRM